MRHNGSGLIAKAGRANGSRNGFSVPIAGFHETTTPPIRANRRGYCHGGCTLRGRARARSTLSYRRHSGRSADSTYPSRTRVVQQPVVAIPPSRAVQQSSFSPSLHRRRREPENPEGKESEAFTSLRRVSCEFHRTVCLSTLGVSPSLSHSLAPSFWLSLALTYTGG